MYYMKFYSALIIFCMNNGITNKRTEYMSLWIETKVLIRFIEVKTQAILTCNMKNY
jgi:hypothetical protein